LEVKGSAVKTTPLFIQKRFPGRYAEWFGKLPEASRGIFSAPIMDNSWYPLREAFVEPTREMCALFFDKDLRGAWELGRFSADLGLRGLYRLFLRFGQTSYIIGRAGVLLGLYYRPAKVEVAEKARDRTVLHFVEFPDPSALVDHRIAGWIERALELSGAESMHVEVSKSKAMGAKFTVITACWK
jgi:hypothetical protein